MNSFCYFLPTREMNLMEESGNSGLTISLLILSVWCFKYDEFSTYLQIGRNALRDQQAAFWSPLLIICSNKIIWIPYSVDGLRCIFTKRYTAIPRQWRENYTMLQLYFAISNLQWCKEHRRLLFRRPHPAWLCDYCQSPFEIECLVCSVTSATEKKSRHPTGHSLPASYL